MKYKNDNVRGYSLGALPEAPIAELANMSRKAATEGIVLLKNKDNTLPFTENDRVSVFGRMQKEYYKSGTGSGGKVNVTYVTNIIDSLKELGKVPVSESLIEVYENWIAEHPFEMGQGWAKEPWSQAEMPIDEALVMAEAEKSNKAVIVFGRTAGEDKDNSATPGSYYLTELEEELLRKVTRHFAHVCVVLNVGNIMDMSWCETYGVDSVLYVWQGGMEGGHAAADVLCGVVTPSGKLSDTIAIDIHDYPSHKNFGDIDYNLYEEDIYVGYRYFETVAPDRVLYPFGFGLSYTTFDTVYAANVAEDTVTVTATVTNTGSYAGKEVVQVYYGAPMGALGKPFKALAAFAKTPLLAPGEKAELSLSFPLSRMASYDDNGATGFRSSYVLEAGDYVIYAGNDVRSAKSVLVHTIECTRLVETCTEALSPIRKFKRMKPVIAKDGTVVMSYQNVPLRSYSLEDRIAENLPTSYEITGDRGYKLSDVAEGKVSMKDFIAQLSPRELTCIVRGEGMNSPKVTAGTGTAFGGVTAELLAYGIPIACATDGPSGIRMDCGAIATSMPNGTLLACTWDLDLVGELYVYEGIEMTAYKIDSILGPGINIHRHPLNGRNFEYFSEDPYLTGMMAVAISKALAEAGVTCTIKHFITNNQETKRRIVDSVVSERALREIYLRPFEIAVKEGGAELVMTTYNPLNGVRTSNSYDLNTRILREEWGFKGIVMTDWWAQLDREDARDDKSNLRAMVRSQNDLYMVVNDASTYADNQMESLENGTLTIGELQRCAENICRYLMGTHSFERFCAGEFVMDTADVNVSEKELVISMDRVPCNTEYELKFPHFGPHTLILEYRCATEDVAQTPINVIIDNHVAASLCVQGNGGEVSTLARTVNLMRGKRPMKIMCDSPDVTIESFKLYK